jgi:hypothetical protein
MRNNIFKKIPEETIRKDMHIPETVKNTGKRKITGFDSLNLVRKYVKANQRRFSSKQ